MAEQAPESLRGKTVRWSFNEGPTKGKTFEHVFNEDGSAKYNEVGGNGQGETVRKCAVEKVTRDVHVVSYLSESGYTLTAVLNFADITVLSFASNEKGWFPARGTFEMVE